jgi:hypothetical protein
MARVVCSKCEVDPEIVTDAEGNAEAVCPGCGQRDNVEDAQRIAGDHAVNQARATLQDAMRDAARGSKIIQFKPGAPTGGTFKWKLVD